MMGVGVRSVLAAFSRMGIGVRSVLAALSRMYVDVWGVLVLLSMMLHVILCPYTKVEESFNMQAIHDLLYHRTDIDKYDHLEFPGVVPRTFIGPIVISALCSPLVLLSSICGFSKMFTQYIVRGCLGLIVTTGFLYFCDSVQTKLGKGVRMWAIIITVSQFHFLFYSSRTLPNCMVLGLVLLAQGMWLNQEHAMFILLAATSILVFRFELLLFLGPIMLAELYNRRLAIKPFFKLSSAAALVVLGISIPVDSFFWRRLLWPEGEVMWFNVFLNKSSQWGVSPFLWYFYSAIPRSLGFSTIFVPMGFYLAPKLKTILAPAVLFVFLFSFLPHKELRFIIYVLPTLNVLAAAAISKLTRRMPNSWMKCCIGVISIGHLVGNVLMTNGLIYISRHNYPGGVAMYKLHELETHSMSYVNVHIDTYAAQTGVTRFTQLHNGWSYNKTEDLLPGGPDMQKFTHLMIGVSTHDRREAMPYFKTHKLLESVNGFHKVQFVKSIFPAKIDFIEKICILRKKNK